MFAQSGNWRLKQIIAKIRSAKDVGKRKNWQRWIRHIPCLIKRCARPNECMTNNMARQREQSQDKPAWEPLNTTWLQNPEALYWNITTWWAKRKTRTKAGKTDPQNVSANSIKWQRWIWRTIKHVSCTHSANQRKSMKDSAVKGSILRRTSLKTTRAKRRPQSLKWYTELSRRRGFKETQRQM